MNDLNTSRKLAACPRADRLLNLLELACLLASVAPVRADSPPTYLFEIDTNAVPGGFYSFWVALDSSNNVYVADNSSNRVVKLASNGNYLTEWGSEGAGTNQFAFPEGIAVDNLKNVYVTDGNNRIAEFTCNGSYLAQWGSSGSGNAQFNNPNGIAVDSLNNVYVVDTDNNRIEKFTSNGSYLAQWGGYGSGNGHFNWPSGIGLDSSNNVYVVDVGNNRVEKFTSNGDYLTQWGRAGSGNGQFASPNGIAVDSLNNVYVTDSDNTRVEKFTSNGSYLTQWGSPGSGNGQFAYPGGIAVDSTGNIIYVSDYFNYRIQVFANDVNIVPPIITQQLMNQTVPAGINVTFSIDVVGTAPFAYQWTSNNVAVPGATTPRFMLTNVSLAASGTYSVLVTNNFGSVLSSAVLDVLPALATTQPASGISLMSVVLNGSVTLRSDEVVAWFEWGTDTNYGHIVGDMIVPGNNGTNSVSASLSGLPGNFYHYRIDAANDLGIVYGNDESFTVGFAPIATTLTPVNSADGTTLNAAVNPNGWDTTVYFKWGPGPSSRFFVNSTPVLDAGAGSTTVNASSFITVTGLTPFQEYFYEVVASNYLGTASGRAVAFLSPPFAGVPVGQWQTIASSADGTKLLAGESFGPTNGIFISTNSGADWTLASTAPAEGVASSADGTKLVAGDWTGAIYLSTDGGAVWTQATNAPNEEWNAFASSADGTRLAAVAGVPGVYTSTNSGLNWTYQTNGLLPYGDLFSHSIASSADGDKLVAAFDGAESIYTSTNFGVNWIQATNAPVAYWYSVASSADGKTLLAGASGSVYLSTNAGATWTKTSLPNKYWSSVAESADGTKMVALANSGLTVIGSGGGGIFTSTNSGATWVSNTVPSCSWTCAAMSADGNEIISTIGGGSTTGGIYVSQTTPSPVLNLNITAGNLLLSWIVPSLGFRLQQNSDLNTTNWVEVKLPPVLQLTNLQEQILLPLPASNAFYRLTH